MAWDVYRTAREGSEGIARRQQCRLDDIVGYARAQSLYYKSLYRLLPEHVSDIRQLPVVNKADLMSHFDDWMTDPAVTKSRVESFLADPANIGRDFLNRYVVCTTSGSTGVPAILLCDSEALAVYNALGYIRSLPASLLTPRRMWALVRGRGRLAAVFVAGGHFLGNVMMARRSRKMPWRRKTQRIFSASEPLDELVADLNDFQPVVLGGYPSALGLLAHEQQAGRLRIHPILVNAAGETLSSQKRRSIAAAFGCSVGNYYGSSEAVGLTHECAAQHLHVNSDWYILEPVDTENRPVAPGELSDDVLVTNLANKIQPIIRYQLGDRVAINPATCACGSPFPQIEVDGRADDVLNFATPQGERIRILPLAFATVAEGTPGVANCQLIQRGPSTLIVRMGAQDDADALAVWTSLRKRLEDFLATQGVTTVVIDRADEPPALHPRSGKFRQVYADLLPRSEADHVDH
ncbi:phenylacetate--CoA ligase family protein [Mycobacterium sp. 3519A]|uniref:phenylacetate--CoA ligase family protein n=1 Tax=Mycobacterium sp. 3519A TaxID=2057184 RepID=UPI001F441C23|nr:phenylacetate--CoA ligase family protein [Mycobacterium sp. 3519A]